MRAEELWRNGPRAESSFTDIAVAAESVNANSRRDQAAAERQIEDNEALEQAALERLSPEDRARYDRVAAVTANDPSARLSLQLLAMEDRLTTGRTAADGANLLTSLDHVATRPVAAGIDHQALVSDMVQEIAFPLAIDQHTRGTCSPTSLQIMMAMENPAEYTRLVGGLASPEGTVQMANGDTIRREAGTEREEELLALVNPKQNTWERREELRTQSSRLWQPALIEYGNGANMDYRNRTDHSYDVRTGAMGTRGLTETQHDTVVDALTGRNYTYVPVNGDAARAASALGQIEQATEAGRLVPATMIWGEVGPDNEQHPLHAVIVTQIHDGRVHFNNPWGQRESMALQDFARHLNSAEL